MPHQLLIKSHEPKENERCEEEMSTLLVSLIVHLLLLLMFINQFRTYMIELIIKPIFIEMRISADCVVCYMPKWLNRFFYLQATNHSLTIKKKKTFVEFLRQNFIRTCAVIDFPTLICIWMQYCVLFALNLSRQGNEFIYVHEKNNENSNKKHSHTQKKNDRREVN